MDKIEIVKQKIVEICNTKKYDGNIYETDEYLFIVKENNIFAIYNNFDNDCFYFVPKFTGEEYKEAQRIEKKLNLDRIIYLPILGGVVSDLKSLIKYYENRDVNNGEIVQIKSLIETLNKKDTIFYNRECEFLERFLNSDLENGIVYVHHQWDHDEAYYYHLPFSVGVNDPLYEIIESDPDITLIEDFEMYEDIEEVDEECNYWIYILNSIDSYIIGNRSSHKN